MQFGTKRKFTKDNLLEQFIKILAFPYRNVDMILNYSRYSLSFLLTRKGAIGGAESWRN